MVKLQLNILDLLSRVLDDIALWLELELELKLLMVSVSVVAMKEKGDLRKVLFS